MVSPTRASRTWNPASYQILVIVSLLLLLACGTDTLDLPLKTVSHRFIATEGTQVFDETALFDSQAVLEWRPDGESNESGWSVEHDSGLIDVTTVTASLSFDASSYDAFEVESSTLGRGKLVFTWRRAEDEAPTEYSVEVGVGLSASGSTRVYRLPLAGHPEWRGSISQIQFRLVPHRGLKVRLNSIRGVQDEFRQDRLAAVLSTPWKVDIGNDLRNALLVVPGVPVEHQLDSTDQAELHFAYGIKGRPSFPIRFQVVAQARDGEVTTLFEDTLPGEEAENIWRDAVVDLSTLSAGVTLRLETEIPGAEDLFGVRVFPFWANPEIHTINGEPGPTIVLISVDTLRADHLSLYGYDRQTTPAIDAWANRFGAVFENAIAPAPWTLPSHVSLFSGLDAHDHGVNFGNPAPLDLTMLAEVLRQEGYSTVAVTGGGFVHPQWGFAQGFDSYRYFAESMGFEDELSTSLATAIDILRQKANRPLFLFFHTYEVHNPFRARQPFFSQFSSIDPTPYHVRIDQPERELEDGFLRRTEFTLLTRGKPLDGGRFPGELENLALDLYDSGIAYTDSMLAELLAELTAGGRQQRTVVVFTSDHGEMLGEHDTYGHASLYEETLRVPLVIADSAGRGAGERISHQVRLIDVMPTILDTIGVAPPGDLDGVSLLRLLEGDSRGAPEEAWSYATTSNYGVSVRVENRFKYMFRHGAFPPNEDTEELYELTADPAEKNNLILQAEESDRFRQRVANRLQQEATGLHFRIVNRGTEPLYGSLGSERSMNSRLKISRVGPVEFLWRDPRHGDFQIPGGRECTFWLEDVSDGILTLSLSIGDPALPGVVPLQTRFEPEKLDVPRYFTYVDGTWREAGGDGVMATAEMTVTWQGRRFDQQSSSPLEVDSQLRDQLEALGYVD